VIYAEYQKALLDHRQRFDRKYVLERRGKMSKTMKIVVFAIFFMVFALLVREVFAQESADLVPRWSFGPTAALSAIGQDGGDTYHNELFTGGAGVQLNVNFVDAANFPWFGVSNPWLFSGSSADDSFRISPGLTLTVAGNFTIGGCYDLFKSVGGIGTGVMTGSSSWSENGRILVGMTVPIGTNAGIWTMGR